MRFDIQSTLINKLSESLTLSKTKTKTKRNEKIKTVYSFSNIDALGISSERRCLVKMLLLFLDLYFCRAFYFITDRNIKNIYNHLLHSKCTYY